MRVIAICVAILGVASLVFGVLFLTQSGSVRQQVADSVAPLTLDQVDAKYNTVVNSHDKIRAAEEPKIQAQTAAPSDMYNYLSSQRALLGLAKSNIGMAMFMQISGIVGIVLGLGMVLSDLALLRKSQTVIA
jgi:hypothetical protein